MTYFVRKEKKPVAWDKQRFWRIIPNTFLRQKSSLVKILSVLFEKAKSHPWKRNIMKEWQLVRFWCEKGLSILAYNSLPKCCSHHLSNWVASWETKFMVTALELFCSEKNGFPKEANKKRGKKIWIHLYSSLIFYIHIGHPEPVILNITLTNLVPFWSLGKYYLFSLCFSKIFLASCRNFFKF